MRGAKQNGTLYLWASRLEFSEPWNVDRLELSLEDHPGKHILLKGQQSEEEKGEKKPIIFANFVLELQL